MTSNHPTPTYTSYAQLLNAHDDLLRQLEATADETGNADIWAQAQTLINAGSDLGKLLDTSRERRAAQSILDYWANTLRRADQDTPSARLASFDPTLAPELPDQPCPYRGLSAFTDTQFFYGREEVTATVLQKLRDGAQLVAVVGPSGSGKSSVVLGGLIEALKNGTVRDADGPSDSATWHTLPILVPGQHALTRLDDALTRDSDNIPNLLVIDQFEELFTLTRDETQSRAFAERLLAWLAQGNRAILTLRSDFEERMQGLPALYEAFEHGRVDLRPMSIAALRSTIEKPAAEVGLRFDEGIVDDVLGKMLGVNEGLPLLQFTLLKLWKLRQRNRVTWEAYRRLGEDPRRALGQSAEAQYQGLTPAQQSIAKRLFLKLVSPKEGENEFTRNRLSRGELAHGENPERVNEVLAKLLDEGLLRITGNEAQIEVMHEALVRNWPTLDQWLHDERNSLERRFLLQRRAARWHEDGRPSQTGLSGRDLEEAARLDGLDDLTQAYVSASVKAEDKAKKREEEFKIAQAVAKIERRRRQVVSVLLAISLVASAVAGWAIWQLQKSLERATTAEKIARSRELAISTQFIIENNSEIAALMALEANQLAYTNESRYALELSLEKSTRSQNLTTYLNGSPSISWHDNTRILVIFDIDGNINISNLDSKHIIATQNFKFHIMEVVISPDSKKLAIVSNDSNVIIWDFYENTNLLLSGNKARINHVSWGQDSKSVYVLSEDKTIRIWDALSGEQKFIFEYRINTPIKIAGSPTENKIAIIDSAHNMLILNTSTGSIVSETMLPSISSVTDISWAPDGKQIAILSRYDGLFIFSIENHNLSQAINIEISKYKSLEKIIWSPNNTHIAATRSGNILSIYNTKDLREEKRLNGHTDSILDASWSPNGNQLMTVSSDKSVRVWDIFDNIKLVFGNKSHPADFGSWSPNGQYFVTTIDYQSLQVYQTANWLNSFSLKGHQKQIKRVSWSPDSQYLVTTSWDDTVRFWNILTGAEIIRPNIHNNGLTVVKWDPSGERIVASGMGGIVYILDKDGNQIKQFGEKFLVGGDDVSWSPDGRKLALTLDYRVKIYNSTTAELLVDLNKHSGFTQRVEWSPNGKKIAIAARNSDVHIWDPQNGNELVKLIGHNGNATAIAWSPDGKYILTGGEDKTARIWDAEDGKEKLRLYGHLDRIKNVSWSPDGKRIATASDDGTVRLYYANIEDLIAIAKTYVTRELTCKERVQYLSEALDCTKRP